MASANELSKQSALVSILKRGKLRVGFEAGYMPFEMVDKKGNFIGFDIDIAREMASAMKVTFVPVNTAWDRIIPALKTGKIDIIMSGMTITPQRNLAINFSDPYFVTGQTILLNKKHESIVESYRDLNASKYTVVSKLATTGEQAVKQQIPKCTYQSFETETEALMQVISGKADAFVYDFPSCVVFLAQHGQDQLLFLDKSFTYEPLAWGIRKGDPDFLNFLNHFLRQIQNDGRYRQIYRKWMKSNRWLKNVQ
ncbi:MAG: glutamine transport system substrate-binding protein [Candidatus Magnetoglobus multicellularis str. Araruama]|uniref:Glutamine transport system substrate-binding protein n=1 Tax=Candidatus Magnetoglobus multicellularis str. Araruama TaxID=890399 RepID=A0A1V1PE72_9BACT|nr:MAG: glutamine transport system substrate-binding protein [Candidatus Magnetoglobus multicellularis str. Araruama]